MNLLGLEMELSNQTLEKKRFLPYVIGWIIGLAPWVVIFMYLGFTPKLDLVPGMVGQRLVDISYFSIVLPLTCCFNI